MRFTRKRQLLARPRWLQMACVPEAKECGRSLPEPPHDRRSLTICGRCVSQSPELEAQATLIRLTPMGFPQWALSGPPVVALESHRHMDYGWGRSSRPVTWLPTPRPQVSGRPERS